MVLSEFAWILVGAAAGLAISIIGFFLKRTMGKVDAHDDSITAMKQTLATKAELKEQRGEIRDEIRQLRSSMDGEIKQLSGTMNDIKDKMLYKEDYYRTVTDINRSIEKLQNYLIEKLGGSGDGK